MIQRSYLRPSNTIAPIILGFVLICLPASAWFPTNSEARHSNPQLLAQSSTPKQTITPKQAIARLFTSNLIQSSWFTADFLSKVPFPQL